MASFAKCGQGARLLVGGRAGLLLVAALALLCAATCTTAVTPTFDCNEVEVKLRLFIPAQVSGAFCNSNKLANKFWTSASCCL